MTPVILGLRMHVRVAVNFRGRGLQNFRFHPLGEAKHVDRAVHARLCRLHRIVLIVDGRSWTGEIVDLVDLKIDRECHIVANELKAFVIEQMLDVATHASEEIVEANDFRTFFQQPFAQMRAEKPGSTCHQNALLKMHQPPSSRPKRIDAILAGPIPNQYLPFPIRAASKDTLCRQPSFSRAFEGSPTRRSTSVGRK